MTPQANRMQLPPTLHLTHIFLFCSLFGFLRLSCGKPCLSLVMASELLTVVAGAILPEQLYV